MIYFATGYRIKWALLRTGGRMAIIKIIFLIVIFVIVDAVLKGMGV